MTSVITPTGVVVTQGRETLRVEAWGRDTIRVQAALDGRFAPIEDALVRRKPSEADVTQPSGDRIRVRAGELVAVVGAEGDLAFHRVSDRPEMPPLLREPVGLPLMGSQNPRGRAFRRLGDDPNHWMVSATFESDPAERRYGLGQQPTGCLDLSGCVVDLGQRNAVVCIPVLVSSRGYGFLWNTPASGRVELGVDRTRWVAERTAQLDYFVYLGATPTDVLARYFDLTGWPRPVPTWVTGFWQSRTRYVSQAELMEVAREHWRRGLPLDVILVDFFHSTRFGDWDWRPDDWPDPAGMVRELREHGCETIVSVWPHLNPRSVNAARFADGGWLVRWADGSPATFAFADLDAKAGERLLLYDATNPDARAELWRQVKRSYADIGIRAFWVDACEPELSAPEGADRQVEARFHRGRGDAVGNLYPFLATSAFRDGLDAAGMQDAVLMPRSAWAGSQRLGAIVWSGDTLSSWKTLRAQVRAGLNMMASGIPWWNSDIGGFVGGDNADEGFRELLVRWFQFGALCPVMRLHGFRGLAFSEDDFTASGGENELWSFGERVYAILRGFLSFRQRLRPYVEATLAETVRAAVPPMVPLWFAYPDQPAATAVEDEYLFGPNLLVAPVTEPGAVARPVWLPEGEDWIDPWTGTAHPGGTMIELPVPLERMPILVRSGSGLSIDESWFEVAPDPAP
jgi:alpha-D-xyloside xylohydrolase